LICAIKLYLLTYLTFPLIKYSQVSHSVCLILAATTVATASLIKLNPTKTIRTMAMPITTLTQPVPIRMPTLATAQQWQQH